MKKTVRVFVNSAQQYDDFSDQVTTHSVGEYNCARNVHTINYAEKLEGDCVVNNVLTLTKDGAELRRSGALTSWMKFYPGETTEAEYINQYGQLDFKVTTSRYDAIIEDDKINVRLHYDLYLNSQKVSHNVLQISIDFVNTKK